MNSPKPTSCRKQNGCHNCELAVVFETTFTSRDIINRFWCDYDASLPDEIPVSGRRLLGWEFNRNKRNRCFEAWDAWAFERETRPWNTCGEWKGDSHEGD